MAQNIQVLPGFYKLLFLYLEPASAILPAPMIWIWPGAAWFHSEQIPSLGPFSPSITLDPRTTLALSHLGNCYMLVGVIVSLVFRAVGEACRNDPVAQERIIGAVLTAMAIADTFHIAFSVLGLPSEILYNVLSWNGLTHGNITFTTFLLCMRVAWFLGIGRHRFYYDKKGVKAEAKRNLKDL
ncbi:hypothetical protein GYMLUDRAFT_233079 [Collybiopsis luxurians FD-317 M1]|uniref:DUF7704 domain-containing protein n=1 Tax=Collybiopsis luxurians FD-317 M1 TaxID=944289 RepID=A0A0D0ARR8_9AGAR|nr:hypothetical protein GYMLUDRAFT_233079 [Collybiopsis luxurians FD-317 M1]